MNSIRHPGKHRHPGESRDPGFKHVFKNRFTTWAPAFAGVTVRVGVTVLLLNGFLFAASSASIQSKLNDLGDRGSGRARAQLHSDLGTALFKEGRNIEASDAFEKALSFDTSRSQRRHIYLFLGKSYESSGRLDKAISAYENATLYDKKNWKRHRDLAGLYEQAELFWKAKASYEEAVGLNPKEPSLFISMGRIWRKIGLYSYAESWLDKALATGTDRPAVQEQLSFVYEGQGRFDRAAAACADTADNGKRLIYLAGLAGNDALVKEGQARLAKSKMARGTRQDYENLVQWLQRPRPPDGKNPFIEEMNQ